MAPDRHKTFRLRGIPLDYRSRTDVRELVKSVLSIGTGAALAVHSLAPSPVEDTQKVATVSFHDLPATLADSSRNEWVVPFPTGDHQDEDPDISRKPLVFDTHFSGFTPFQRCDESACDIDVVALTGLGGHAFGSFKERGGAFMWLRDALPLDLPNARILTYGYDTRVIRSSSFQNLTDLGKALQIDIGGTRASGHESRHSRPIVFIGHSLGGLVIKEAIVKMKECSQEYDREILDSTVAFLFFGVPHEGMEIESLVPLVKDQPNRSLLESLNKNSGLLQRLKKDFSNSFGINHPQIVSFYETEKSPTAVEVEKDKWEPSEHLEVRVDVSSATFGSRFQHPINRNHSELVKFTSHYDEVYVRVWIALRPLVTGIRRTSMAGTIVARAGASGLLSESQRECLRSLAFKNQDSRYHEVHTARGTCSWLLQDLKYQSWINEQRGLFWIKGNPGTGKSVLMKFAVTRMEERKSGELVLSFFIHGRGSKLQRSPLGVLRSLLNCMLDSFPDYLSDLTKKFEDREKRRGSYQEKRWEWEEKELGDFMSLVLTNGTKTQPVAIYIDALDECGEETAKSLLVYLKKLMNDIKEVAGQVKICFSSRHYPILELMDIPTIFVEDRNDRDIRYVIMDQLSGVQPKEKRQQIEKQIFLKAHGGFQWAVLVAAIAVDHSNKRVKAESIYEKIKQTPEALEELYEDILKQVTKAEQAQTIKLFQWVLFAERALSAQELREALVADKDMPCTTTHEMRNHPDCSDTIEDFETRVKHLSRGLVEFQTREFWEQYEVDGEDSDREAQFIHQSVADYLRKSLPNPVPHITGAQASQLQISRSCIRYLTLKDVLEKSDLSRGKLSALYPLAPYAVQYLFSHVRKLDAEGFLQLDLLRLIHWHEQSKRLRQIADLWRVLDCNNAYTPIGWPFLGATPLHVLVALGVRETFHTTLQEEDVEVDGRDSERNTPFMLAIREGYNDMAITLLDRSLEWQNRQKTAVANESAENKSSDVKGHLVDIAAENNDGDTPMALAFTGQDIDLICRLIDAGADLEAFAHESQLIFLAISTRHRRLFTKLIEKSAKLDGAIFFAVTQDSNNNNNGDIEWFISELLKAGANTSRLQSPDFDIDYGDDFDEDYGHDEDAVLVATRRGQTAIVELLLLHGASAACCDFFERTPLSLAVRDSHMEMVRAILQRAPSTIDTGDRYKITPLAYATVEGKSEIATLLITEGNACIDVHTSLGQSVLELAVRSDSLTLVNAILQRQHEFTKSEFSQAWRETFRREDVRSEGIADLLVDHWDVSTPFDDNTGTPLISAVRRELLGVVAAILRKDKSTVNFVDGNGNAALHHAINQRLEKVAISLLRNGASPFIKDRLGRTSVVLAVQNELHDVLKAVVDLEIEQNPNWEESGTSLNAVDASGATPLSYAIRGRNYEAVRLLRETEKAEVLSKLLSQVIMFPDDHMAEILLRSTQVVLDFPSRYHIETARVHSIDDDPEITLLAKEVCQNYEEIPPIVIAAAFKRQIIVNSLLNTGKISIDSVVEASEVATALQWTEISQALFDFLGKKSNLTIRERNSSDTDIEL